MNNSPATKKLYAQFREAMRRHDDDAAIASLQEILTIDPNDQDARTQMNSLRDKAAQEIAAQLTAAMQQKDENAIATHVQRMESLLQENERQAYPIYLKAKAGMQAKQTARQALDTTSAGADRTKHLYRQFRDAQRNRQEEKAFDILKDILSIDPSDNDALAQVSEIGQRLCTQKAPELSALLRSGRIDELTALIDQMEKWAKKDYLMSLPDYASADTLVGAMRRKKAQTEINESLEDLKKNTYPIEHQNKVAYEIEKLAAKHNIVLDPNDHAFISEIHQRYQTNLTETRQEEKAAELGEQLNALAEQVQLRQIKNDQELVQLDQQLDAIYAQLDEVGDNAMRDALNERITKYKRLINKLQKDRSFKRGLKYKISAIVIFGIFSLGGAAIYSYENADDSTIDMMACIKRKSVDEGRELLNTNALIVKFSELFSSDYKLARNNLTAWISQFDKLQSEAKKLTKELAEHPSEIDLGSIQADMELISKMSLVQETLKKEYNFTFSEKEIREWNKFASAIAETKQLALAKYTTPPQKATLEELKDIFTEFRKNVPYFNFSESEQEAVHTAISDVAKRILLLQDKTSIPTENDINQSLNLFREYSEPLMLDNSIQRQLDKLNAAIRNYNSLEKKLAGASTIGEYAKQLLTIEDLRMYLPNIYDAKDISRITPALCAQLAFDRTNQSISPGVASDNKAYDLLKKIHKIFQSGGTDVYMGFTQAIRSSIDAITEENDGIWNDKYDQVITKSGNVYVGKTSKINNSIKVQVLNDDGTESGKEVTLDAKTCTKSRLRTANMRNQLGFKRIDLQRCTTPPVDLLNNITESTEENYPQMAKAWLFKQTLDLMDSYSEPMATGVAFSPRLQADIEEFRKLARKHNLRAGCWLKPHKESQDKEFKAFFAKIAKHKYRTEIANNLHTILNCTLKYAAFVDSNGRFIRLENKADELYYISFSDSAPTLVKAVPGKLPIFTPLFKLN